MSAGTEALLQPFIKTMLVRTGEINSGYLEPKTFQPGRSDHDQQRAIRNFAPRQIGETLLHEFLSGQQRVGNFRFHGGVLATNASTFRLNSAASTAGYRTSPGSIFAKAARISSRVTWPLCTNCFTSSRS